MSKHAHCHQNKTDFFFWITLSTVTFLFLCHLTKLDQLTGQQWILVISETTYHMVHTMWWGVLIGILFIGALSKIPREFILFLLGSGGKTKGILRATCAGVLLDLCSHGILMIAIKLYQRGASAGQVIAFLLASPWNSFSLTIILFALIGVKWTLVFILLSMLIAIITGLIFNRLEELKQIPANPNYVDLPNNFKFIPAAKSELDKVKFNSTLFKDIVFTGLNDSKLVLKWLFFGIILAAIVRASFDANTFESWFGPTIFGLSMTILISTIIEVCSEGSTPLASDILNRAKAPGNAFAFLMAGVATDYTEIMSLKDVTSSWKFALFLPLITLPQIAILSFLLNKFAQ